MQTASKERLELSKNNLTLSMRFILQNEFSFLAGAYSLNIGK